MSISFERLKVIVAILWQSLALALQLKRVALIHPPKCTVSTHFKLERITLIYREREKERKSSQTTHVE